MKDVKSRKGIWGFVIDCHCKKYFTFIQGRKIWCTRCSSDISALRGTTHTHKTLLISRLTSSHPSVFEERGDSMIILFVRHQMIFLWPLDIWNTDNRQFLANGPHRIASFISDKPPEQIYSFRSINDTNTMWRERVVSFEWRHSLQRCPNKPVWRRAEGCEVSGGVWLRLLLIPKTCVCLCLHLLSGCCEAIHELLTDRQTNSADF